MTIEFEFYFKGDFDEGNIKHSAWYALSKYIKANQDLGNIGSMELIEMTDWDEGEGGIHCCAVLKGEEIDLKYLVFKNVGIDQGPEGFLGGKIMSAHCHEKLILPTKSAWTSVEFSDSNLRIEKISSLYTFMRHIETIEDIGWW